MIFLHHLYHSLCDCVANRDGNVSLQELETFLFPEHEAELGHEIGVVISLSRKVSRCSINKNSAILIVIGYLN